ncbi:MAG: hypothetical protein CMB98_06885 [Flavobacteriaceae bacterium]|nr:hypothetical protein [Flavobacteriaceae bacterium]
MSTLAVDAITNAAGTNAMSIDSNGYLFAKLPHFLMRNSSAQSFPNSTYTRVEFNDSVLDTHSFVDLTNNRINFTSTNAGVYQINLGGKMENIAANRVGYWLRKEGVMNTGPYVAYFEEHSYGASYIYPTYSFIYNFVDGDFLELDMYQTHGSAKSSYVVSQAIGFFMSGVRIG